MAPLWIAVFASLTSFAVAYFGYWLIGKPRLYVYSPISTGFRHPPAQEGANPVAIRAGQVVVQNAGRKSATKVQIVAQPGWNPWGYTIVPNIDHEVRAGPQEQWMIEIAYLGPGETVTVQILNGPNIDTVRSMEGPAKVVDVIHQRVFPRWVQSIVLVLMLVGFITMVYAMVRMIVAIAAVLQ
jgi:hypothetical protein